MSVGFSTAIRNARLDAITSVSGNGALLRLYTGTRPATGAAVTDQTLLGTLICGSPLAPSAHEGVLTFNPIAEDSSADASGTCTWARMLKADGVTHLMDFTVSADGGGGDITMNSVTVSAGQALEAVSATLAEGNV